jgi:hypothetical protein
MLCAQEVVKACFKALYQHLLKETEEKRDYLNQESLSAEKE